MKGKFLFVCCILAWLLNVNVLRAQVYATVGFYNVENLFDTVDDPRTEDAEFLPDGKNHWTDECYGIKLKNIAAVISAIKPGIMGLGEIENRKVLEDLVTQPGLVSLRYQVIHFDMNDARGIDVALIYQPAVFKPFFTRKIAIKDPEDTTFRTRDILWVKGLFMGDTLHVAVNHWPSRLGGKDEKRLLAAATLRHATDSVLAVNPEAKIVMMGDFNDDPNNRSIRKVLMGDENGKSTGFVNTAEPTFKKGFGTLGYNGVWNLFDQIIISAGLADRSGVDYREGSFGIFAPQWMQEPGGKYKGMPQRSFRGGKFNPSGFSDHYPAYILLQKID